MNAFLELIFPQLRELEIGVNLQSLEVYRNVNFYLLFAVFDKPARASALNLISSTGYYSCLKCVQKGLNVRTKSNGSKRVFPFIAANPKGPKRSESSYSKVLARLDKRPRESLFGVKGTINDFYHA